MGRDHQRKLIRRGIQALLKAGLTDAEDRVFTTRVFPFKSTQLPAIAIYAVSEATDAASAESAPRILERTVQIAIEGAVKFDQAKVDDLIDDLTLQIERAMDRDQTFGNLCCKSHLASTELDVQDEGDRTFGVVRLTYDVLYLTDSPDPADVELDVLNTIDIKTNVGGQVDPADQAEDQVTVNQT